MSTQQLLNTEPVSRLDQSRIEQLARTLSQAADLEFAVLIGSRATESASFDSDWDIALQWKRGLDGLATLAQTETLRHQLANALSVQADAIDLIDLPHASLAMRAVVAEEGIPLVGDDTLAWVHFLSRTWREMEMFYWDKDDQRAA